MNIKYLIFMPLFLSPFLILGQKKTKEDALEIDITQLKKGYWLAENQSDSTYLSISNSRCYYSTKALPRKARMYADLAHVSLERPQKVLQERRIIIEFDYLDTLPEPLHAPDGLPDFDKLLEETEIRNKEIYTTEYAPKVFIFKQLLPNKLILQEKDSLKRLVVFNKLAGENPNFRQIQINKLDTIAKKMTGLWGNEQINSFFTVEGAYSYHENWLQFEPNLSGSSIVFLINPDDSITAKHEFIDVKWEKDSEYILWLSLSKICRYKMDFITDEKLLLTNDSLRFKAYYSKMPIEPFPDSILKGLQSKAWCDTIHSLDNPKIDTTVFDFGERADVPNGNYVFNRPHGHLFGRGFHSDIFLDFFAFHNHYYFIRSTHGSIGLCEIVSLTPNELTIRKFIKSYYDDEEKVEVKTYFLHPESSEYFEEGRRIRY